LARRKKRWETPDLGGQAAIGDSVFVSRYTAEYRKNIFSTSYNYAHNTWGRIMCCDTKQRNIEDLEQCEFGAAK